MPAVPVIADALHREFMQRNNQPLVAVRDATFRVHRGEVFGLLGPNGAGKSTTLRMISALLRPTSGSAYICGHNVAQEPHKARAKLGYLSASSGLPGLLTCREVLRTFAVLHRAASPQKATEEALVRFGIRRYADRFVQGLSTGMRQRLRIACAAVHRPPVLILDEPTAGLDVVAADSLLADIETLRDDGVAIIFSTHVLLEAQRVCDRIGVIYDGAILAVDSPSSLVASAGARDLREAFLTILSRQ